MRDVNTIRVRPAMTRENTAGGEGDSLHKHAERYRRIKNAHYREIL